jgi:SAM-dependent methyltransferase
MAADQSPLTASLNRSVSPADEMVTPGAESDYFAIGERALELIKLAAKLSGRPDYQNILDLPCGHGRVMRWIQAHYPRATLTGCDLNQAGVDFCCEQFGAKGVYSDVDLSRVQFDAPFDLIWCGSLLTHLPVAKALTTLDQLLSWASEDAVIMFTTQGRYFSSLLARDQGDFADNADIVSLLERYVADGAAFAPYYEDPQRRYGLMLMTPEFLTRHLQQFPQVILRAYLEQAWGVQDVVILYKKENFYADLLGESC